MRTRRAYSQHMATDLLQLDNGVLLTRFAGPRGSVHYQVNDAAGRYCTLTRNEAVQVAIALLWQEPVEANGVSARLPNGDRLRMTLHDATLRIHKEVD